MIKIYLFILLFFFAVSASYGDSEGAKYNLAMQYYNEKEFSKALPLLEELEMLDNTEARYILGVMYVNGEGVLKDYRKARWLLKNSINFNISEKIQRVITIFRVISPSEVNNLIKKSSDKGHAEGHYGIAQIFEKYYRGYSGGLFEYKKAVKWYKKAVEKGHIEAMYKLAVLYEEGEQSEFKGKSKSYFFKKRPEEAVALYKKAKDLGHKKAGDKYAYLSPAGEAVEEYKQALLLESGDPEKAFILFKKSAEAGYKKAQFKLALIYDARKGKNKKENLENKIKAFELYRKASKQGHQEADYNLAIMFYLGEGVKRDIGRAAKLFYKRAKEGHHPSQHSFAKMLCNRQGVYSTSSIFHLYSNPLPECSKWARKAKEGGEDVSKLWNEFNLWKY